MGEARHRKRVLDLFAAAGKNEKWFTAQRQLGFGNLVMTQVHRDVLRLDVGRLQVQHVEVLAELDNIARVLERAGALAAIEIGNMRGAADAGKSDVVTTEGDISFRNRAVQGKFAGC